MLFSDIFYIIDDHTLSFRKCFIPPVDYIHINVLQGIDFRDNSFRTPFIGIICAMSFLTIFKNVDSVRTDMLPEKADKFIDLLIRCIIIKRRSESLIDNQLILYYRLHIYFSPHK